MSLFVFSVSLFFFGGGGCLFRVHTSFPGCLVADHAGPPQALKNQFCAKVPPAPQREEGGWRNGPHGKLWSKNQFFPGDWGPKAAKKGKRSKNLFLDRRRDAAMWQKSWPHSREIASRLWLTPIEAWVPFGWETLGDQSRRKRVAMLGASWLPELLGRKEGFPSGKKKDCKELSKSSPRGWHGVRSTK